MREVRCDWKDARARGDSCVTEEWDEEGEWVWCLGPVGDGPSSSGALDKAFRCVSRRVNCDK